MMPPQALEGVRVVDFCHGWAGPYMTNLLADFGAEVIKIESRENISGARASMGGANYNLAEFARNKKSITINMKTTEGIELARKLIAISDVVTENFSLRVMRNWGLDYDHVKETKPDIIMASLQGLGQTGPHREYLTWGSNLMPLTGMTHYWGFPEIDNPAGTKSYYPDFVGGVHGAFAILAALNYRAKTGKGQHIDLAQVEAAAALIPTLYMDAQVNKRVRPRIGNRSREFAPQNCYRCQGEDAWCVISIPDQERWECFCRALGHPSWTNDEKFSTPESRLAHVDQLDSSIESWTSTRTPYEVMEILQKAGVSAGPVGDPEILLHDPHLKAREFFVAVEHPFMGPVTHPGPPSRLSLTPSGIRRPAPLLGEHNPYVFSELLGLSEDDIRGLEEKKIIY